MYAIKLQAIRLKPKIVFLVSLTLVLYSLKVNTEL